MSSWLLLRNRWESGYVPSGCCNIMSISCCTSSLLLRNRWASGSVSSGSCCNEDMSISIPSSSSLSCCTSALLLRNQRSSGSVSASDSSGSGGGTNACIALHDALPIYSRPNAQCCGGCVWHLFGVLRRKPEWEMEIWEPSFLLALSWKFVRTTTSIRSTTTSLSRRREHATVNAAEEAR